MKVAATRLKLLGGEAAVPAGRRAANPEAYAQFLLGRQLLNRGVSEDYRRSVEAYERALALEPSYAPAHAELSSALAFLVNSTLTTRPTAPPHATTAMSGRTPSAAPRSTRITRD